MPARLSGLGITCVLMRRKVRRPEDASATLWSALNRVQESLVRGGLTRRTASGRLTRMRRITATREDLQLNSRLWDLAMEVLAA